MSQRVLWVIDRSFRRDGWREEEKEERETERRDKVNEIEMRLNRKEGNTGKGRENNEKMAKCEKKKIEKL